MSPNMPVLITFAWVTLTIAVIGVAVTRWWRQEHHSVPNHLKKLPGPTQYPLVGRIHDFPIKFVWYKFTEWANKYGPLYRTTVMGKTFIVISDERIANELLEKRGAIYSDRPSVPALHDSKSNTGTGEFLPLMGRNEYWVRQRHFAHQALAESQNAAFYGYPELEAKRLLFQLLMTPYRYSPLLEDFTAKVIARLAWGRHEESDNLKRDAWALLTQMSPAGPLNNVIEPLNLIPKWINPWKLDEEKRHARQEKWFRELQGQVREDMDSKCARPSWTRHCLQKMEKYNFDDDREASYAVGMLAVAGVFTVGGPLHTFLLAMVQHKQWLWNVQEELDRVVGDRMPTFADSEQLPTLRAVIKEAIRWRPAVPTGVAHQLEADDDYEGFFIPKGSYILPLEWAFTRDEKNYPDAESFKPERWLDARFPTYREPLTKYPTIKQHSLFGWGRRVCQGQNLTYHELLVGCGAIAWAFNLSKKKDQFGRDIPIPLSKTNSLLIIKPDPFEFEITPRSPERAQQVIQNWHDVESESPIENIEKSG